MVLTNRTCPAINDLSSEQTSFWDGRWDAHEVGWLIAGATAAISTAISFTTFFLHARNYYLPKEQRQMLRILLMPPVYAIVSFFSYRFFKAYTLLTNPVQSTDYAVALVSYEALVLAAFLMLLLQYIGDSTAAQKKVLMEKEKRKIPIPFCCIRFRPSKPYFLHALKWSVLQYSLLRPLISISAIITNAYGVLCPTQYSVYFAEVYLDSVDFVSITVALYGLIVFYALVRDRLKGRQPLAKFLGIKGIVMVTFYQGFIFGILEDYDVIKATEYWTATNVADGLQALCTCCEMVFFSALFHWAFGYKHYKEMRPLGAPHTNVFWATLDSFNYSDFILEGWRGIVFAVRFMLGRPGTRASNIGPLNIDDAFASNPKGSDSRSDSSTEPMRNADGMTYPLTATEYPSNDKYYQEERETALPPNAYGGSGRPSGDEPYYAFGDQGQQYKMRQESTEEYERRTAYADQQNQRKHPYSNY